MADWPFPPRQYRHAGCRTVILEVNAPADELARGTIVSSQNVMVRRGNGQMERPNWGSVAMAFCPDCARPVRLAGLDSQLEHVL